SKSPEEVVDARVVAASSGRRVASGARVRGARPSLIAAFILEGIEQRIPPRSAHGRRQAARVGGLGIVPRLGRRTLARIESASCIVPLERRVLIQFAEEPLPV